jgi:hypothetical protein
MSEDMVGLGGKNNELGRGHDGNFKGKGAGLESMARWGTPPDYGQICRASQITRDPRRATL